MNRLRTNYTYSGVYAIVNRVNGKRYIGSSENIDGRVGDHKSKLKRGTHISKDLQADYNNGHNFVFDVLYVEAVMHDNRSNNRQRLYQIEREYIKKYNSIETGYNNSPI